MSTIWFLFTWWWLEGDAVRLGWRLLVTRWDKLQLTPSFSKYNLILVHEVERIYAPLEVTRRGSPSGTVARTSPVQGCLVIQLLSSVCEQTHNLKKTNDMMLTVSPLYLSLCKLQNYLHYSTFQFVLTLLLPNKNAIKLLHILGILKIFCLIGASEFMFHAPSQSKISPYILISYCVTLRDIFVCR